MGDKVNDEVSDEMGSAKDCATPFDARNGNFFRFEAQGRGKSCEIWPILGFAPAWGRQKRHRLAGSAPRNEKNCQKERDLLRERAEPISKGGMMEGAPR